MYASRGFSLLEMLVVLLMIALIAGLMTPQIADVSSLARERNQMESLTGRMASVRVEAMRRVRTMEVEGILEGDTMTLLIDGEPSQTWRPWRTTLSADDREPTQSFRVVFDARGRTATRLLQFNGAEDSDRIWQVRFDPISGSPGLHREDQGA